MTSLSDLQIVRKTVGELVYYTVGYMQMTEEQVLVSSTLSGLVVSYGELVCILRSFHSNFFVEYLDI